MFELVDECVYIFKFLFPILKQDDLNKCDVNIGHVLKRMLLLSIVEKLVAGSCTECCGKVSSSSVLPVS